MRRQQRLTAQRKRLFLEELRRSGIVRRAAAAASPGARDAAKTFYNERDRSPTFAAAWDAALDAAIGDAEHTLLEVGSGRVVVEERTLRDGSVARRYANPDTRALQLYLAARCPEYRRQSVVEASVEARAKVETTRVTADLTNLSDEELAQLEQLLARGTGR
jgi:hypothetical protein